MNWLSYPFFTTWCEFMNCTIGRKTTFWTLTEFLRNRPNKLMLPTQTTDVTKLNWIELISFSRRVEISYDYSTLCRQFWPNNLWTISVIPTDNKQSVTTERPYFTVIATPTLDLSGATFLTGDTFVGNRIVIFFVSLSFQNCTELLGTVKYFMFKYTYFYSLQS